MEAHITPALTESSAAESSEPCAAMSPHGFSELMHMPSAPLPDAAAVAPEVSNVPDVVTAQSAQETQVELEIKTEGAAPVPAQGAAPVPSLDLMAAHGAASASGAQCSLVEVQLGFHRQAVTVTCSDLLPVSGRAISSQTQILHALQLGKDCNIPGMGPRGSGDPATDMTWMALGYNRDCRTYPVEQRLHCQFHLKFTIIAQQEMKLSHYPEGFQNALMSVDAAGPLNSCSTSKCSLTL